MPENNTEMLDNLNQDDFNADTDLENEDFEGGTDKSEDDKSQPNTDENAKTQQELEEEAKKKAEADALKEKNAKYAKQRREREEAEAKAKEERLEREIRTKIELENNKINPYTKLPIKDEYDLEIYKKMKKYDDEGKDPLVEFANQLANDRRNEELEKSNKAKNEEARKTKISEEIESFKRNYPDVDVMTVVKDTDMFKWAQENGKANRWTLEEIYEGYQLYKAKVDSEKKKAEAEAKAKAEANKQTKTPSSDADGTIKPKDVNEMTREEFDKYFASKYS